MCIRKEQLNTLLWAWKGQLLKVKEEVERALRFILKGLEGVGWSLGFGLKRKPILGGHDSEGGNYGRLNIRLGPRFNPIQVWLF
jgi:hypothetical protein